MDEVPAKAAALLRWVAAKKMKAASTGENTHERERAGSGAGVMKTMGDVSLNWSKI